jgi:branched-chain amino acid transport system ATP-binding protein
MSLLEGIGLRRAFDGLVAVANVTFHLKAGEMLALIGPNGAGKSTLFNLLSGQLALDAGQVMFNGLNITGATPTQIARLGIGRIFQTASVFGSMTVRENVQVAAIAGNGKTFRFNHPASAYYRESVDVLLVQLGLAQMADRGAGELAYGDTKRLELALALINQPKLLLMDEPTAGMGLAERAEVMALVRSIAQARGMAILFTEHDMAAVFATADRVLVLDRGVVIAEGPPAAIRANRRVQAVYLGEDV